MSFPTATPSYAGFISSHTLLADGHAGQHNQEQADIIALAVKLGLGSSVASTGKLLIANGPGSSVWGQVDLPSMVSGILSQANGGTGQSSLTSLPLTTPVITDPAISGGGSWSGNPVFSGQPNLTDFTNMQHDHGDNDDAGQLVGSTALVNSSVTPDKLATGAASNSVATAQTTASTSFTDLATTGPAVTVTIGANGLALVIIGGNASNNTSATASAIGFALSGPNNTAAASSNQAYSVGTGATTGLSFTGTSAFIVSGLNPGSTTFTAKYIVSGGTGSFQFRTISVIPL